MLRQRLFASLRVTKTVAILRQALFYFIATHVTFVKVLLLPVVLERAVASEGPHRQLVCRAMFVRSTKCRMVRAEILHFVQNDQEKCKRRESETVKAETLRFAQSDWKNINITKVGDFGLLILRKRVELPI